MKRLEKRIRENLVIYKVVLNRIREKMQQMKKAAGNRRQIRFFAANRTTIADGRQIISKQKETLVHGILSGRSVSYKLISKG